MIRMGEDTSGCREAKGPREKSLGERGGPEATCWGVDRDRCAQKGEPGCRTHRSLGESQRPCTCPSGWWCPSPSRGPRGPRGSLSGRRKSRLSHKTPCPAPTQAAHVTKPSAWALSPKVPTTAGTAALALQGQRLCRCAATPSQAHVPARSLCSAPCPPVSHSCILNRAGEPAARDPAKSHGERPQGERHMHWMQRPRGQRLICGSGAPNMGPKASSHPGPPAHQTPLAPGFLVSGCESRLDSHLLHKPTSPRRANPGPLPPSVPSCPAPSPRGGGWM